MKRITASEFGLTTVEHTDIGPRRLVNWRTENHERDAARRHRGDAHLMACIPDRDYFSYRTRVTVTVNRGLV
jgi:hypothetical protein